MQECTPYIQNKKKSSVIPITTFLFFIHKNVECGPIVYNVAKERDATEFSLYWVSVQLVCVFSLWTWLYLTSRSNKNPTTLSVTAQDSLLCIIELWHVFAIGHSVFFFPVNVLLFTVTILTKSWEIEQTEWRHNVYNILPFYCIEYC